ncbi:Cathepsin L [Dirofilaria immitis]|nr:Cathepsin L [Dirofilaria immitis]
MEKLETEWKDYVTSLGKHYDTEENNLRMAIFEGNELMTEETNRKYKEGLITYTTALNEFADLTDEEFKLMHGLRIPNETYLHKNRRTRQTLGQIYRYDPNEQLPDSMDWRKSGYVSSVKNQGECGSCYAFAATAALEAYYKRRVEDLSIYHPKILLIVRIIAVISVAVVAFEYAAYYGIAQERQYPYAATVQNCRWHKRIALVNDKGYAYIPQGDELALKSAVAKYGPVVVGISASKRAFRFYSSGVFSHRNCGHLDHAVLVVGYGTDNNYGDYWIVKNSWGTSWGEAGYIYMARNRGNMCHIASMASFPI